MNVTQNKYSKIQSPYKLQTPKKSTKQTPPLETIPIKKNEFRLEIPLHGDNRILLDLVKFNNNVFLLSGPKDYHKLKDALNYYIVENKKQTEDQYNQLLQDRMIKTENNFIDRPNKTISNREEFIIDARLDMATKEIVNYSPHSANFEKLVEELKINDDRQAALESPLKNSNRDNDDFKQLSNLKIDNEKIDNDGEWKVINDKLYKGFYTEGKWDGFGEWKGIDESYYKGQLNNGLKDGFGEFKDNQGNIYKGKWKNGLRHGRGNLQYADGSLYIGDFEEDFEHGYGKFRAVNGDVYRGAWVKGLKTGRGEWIKNGGAWYKGDLENGLRHGNGESKEVNGEQYMGDFKNDLYDGYGELKFNDMNWYKGGFKNGLRHGEGVWRTDVGGWYKGRFVDGKRYYEHERKCK